MLGFSEAFIFVVFIGKMSSFSQHQLRIDCETSYGWIVIVILVVVSEA